MLTTSPSSMSGGKDVRVSGRKRILVVDDEDNYRALLQKVLTKEGYEVETAQNGKAALLAVHGERFDLAILDLRMFPIDGLEVLENIQRESPATKTMVLTAYPSPENKTRAYEKGAHDYLMKPVDLQDLKLRVARVLAGDAGTEGVGLA